MSTCDLGILPVTPYSFDDAVPTVVRGLLGPDEGRVTGSSGRVRSAYIVEMHRCGVGFLGLGQWVVLSRQGRE